MERNWNYFSEMYSILLKLSKYDTFLHEMDISGVIAQYARNGGFNYRWINVMWIKFCVQETRKDGTKRKHNYRVDNIYAHKNGI